MSARHSTKGYGGSNMIDANIYIIEFIDALLADERARAAMAPPGPCPNGRVATETDDVSPVAS